MTSSFVSPDHGACCLAAPDDKVHGSTEDCHPGWQNCEIPSAHHAFVPPVTMTKTFVQNGTAPLDPEMQARALELARQQGWAVPPGLRVVDTDGEGD